MAKRISVWGAAAWPLLVLLAAGGCSPKAPQVSFTPPPVTAAMEDQAPAEKLENLPQATLLERGDRYLAEGNLALARLHFLRALVRDPDSPAAWAGQGRVLLQAGELEPARQAFQRALDLDRNHRPALLGAGRTARLAGHNEAATGYFQTLLQASPDDTEALTELAINFDAEGREGEAETAFRRVTELRPHDPAGFNNLGFSLLLQQRYGEAVDVFRRALQLAPDQGRIRNNLAAALVLNGEEQRGLILFEETVGKAEAFNNAGYLLLSRAQWAQAEKAFAKALSLSPVYYPRAERNLAYLHLLEDERSAAVRPDAVPPASPPSPPRSGE